jgi:hypothetical protein
MHPPPSEGFGKLHYSLLEFSLCLLDEKVSSSAHPYRQPVTVDHLLLIGARVAVNVELVAITVNVFHAIVPMRLLRHREVRAIRGARRVAKSITLPAPDDAIMAVALTAVVAGIKRHRNAA